MTRKGGTRPTTQVENLMMLPAAAAQEVERVYDAALAEVLPAERPRANVMGVATGVKWSNGRPTGEPALLVLVTHKVAPEQLSAADLVPATIDGMQTDVLQIGFPIAGGNEPLGVGTQTLARRIRPAEGGYSVGHFSITAGTIATCVYDILPGGTITPPAPGVGVPSRYYILSNNHVLANPADRIATLSRFIPITFDPPTPRALHNNLVDCAIAAAEFHDIDREIYWTGYVRGWRPRANVTVGTVVQKTGRTTNYTLGRITAVNATVDVGYGGGRVARFRDQIITTNISAGGDSGSLVTTVDDVAVGLLFAGSSTVTILNQIENVRALLRVEVAEEIL
jgi:hypothetical protein